MENISAGNSEFFAENLSQIKNQIQDQLSEFDSLSLENPLEISATLTKGMELLNQYLNLLLLPSDISHRVRMFEMDIFSNLIAKLFALLALTWTKITSPIHKPQELAENTLHKLTLEFDSLLNKAIDEHPFWNLKTINVIKELRDYLELHDDFYKHLFLLIFGYIETLEGI